MFIKEPLTEWFFVEPKMLLQWHCLKHHYFEECIINEVTQMYSKVVSYITVIIVVIKII